MADFNFQKQPDICTNCSNPGTKERALKPCTKCKITPYCSRNCRKSDWKSHKKSCSQNAQDRADRIASIEAKMASASELASAAADLATSLAAEPTEQTSGPRPPSPSATERIQSLLNRLETGQPFPKIGPALGVQIPNPFQRIKDKKWLHDRPKEDIYKLLIDAYRLRMDDDYKFLGLKQPNTPYADANCDGTASLEIFLRMAELLSLLPTWWDESETTACVESAKLLTWSNTAIKITADYVRSYYEDPSMPMQLRIIAEQVVRKDIIGIEFLKLLDAEVLLERSHEYVDYVIRQMEAEPERSQEILDDVRRQVGELDQDDGKTDVDPG
ncbi:MYND domain protein [Penicillium manginii]|uniref:MYND domain protein n=1 Tax=Penicillium manginii TaxID=203109 RepID=UPI0025468200|nr:MYND domain protein [Penicillium manginii]KAJ5750735.1 MYND domain protein [Penicillium manginii]